MEEHIHRTFQCSPETPRPQVLPDLLGLRTTYKENLQPSPTEMVFGTSLRIPGDFISTPEQIEKNTLSVADVRRLFKALRPVPVLKDLQTCEFDFRRVYTVLGPLEPPYSGPH